MKHVPGENTVSVSPKEQLEILRERLLGNSAFAMMRGRYANSFLSVAQGMIEATDSPSAFVSRWDHMATAARSMGVLLSQLKRDGYDVAYEQLRLALCNARHVIPGETIPLHEMETYTVLMLMPEVTMVMLDWLVNYSGSRDRNTELWYYNHWVSQGKPQEEDQPDPLTAKLFETFPGLARNYLCTQRHNRDRCRALEQEYTTRVLSHFPQIGQFLLGLNCWTRQKARALALSPGTGDESLPADAMHLAYLFKHEQSEVLGMFPRELQSHVATWQFSVPKALHKLFYIGIHPEHMHEKCAELFPALVSKGLSHNLGGVVLSNAPLKIEGYPYYERRSSEQHPGGILFATQGIE